MNRSELIEKIAVDTNQTKTAVAGMLDSFIDAVQATVKKGDTVALVGFGTFKQVSRAARTGKNPRTGVPLKIPAAKLPKFTAGSKFKAVVDPKGAARKAAKK
jgi:DNA-binding protein HU-beta